MYCFARLKSCVCFSILVFQTHEWLMTFNSMDAMKINQKPIIFWSNPTHFLLVTNHKCPALKRHTRCLQHFCLNFSYPLLFTYLSILLFNEILSSSSKEEEPKLSLRILWKSYWTSTNWISVLMNLVPNFRLHLLTIKLLWNDWPKNPYCLCGIKVFWKGLIAILKYLMDLPIRFLWNFFFYRNNRKTANIQLSQNCKWILLIWRKRLTSLFFLWKNH